MASSAQNEEPAAEESFFATILSPGSSLNPTFLAVLDGAFGCLFIVLLALAWLTSGNLHVFVLLGIELGLWASVKWFVNELKDAPIMERPEGEDNSKKVL